MRILFLSTWFPYPPDQGCKIRAYHLLAALAWHHETILVSFQDGFLEPGWRRHLEGLCRRVEIVGRHPFAATRSGRLRGLVSLRPSSVVATCSAEMADRVRALAADWQPDRVVALTFVTAPYALSAGGKSNHVVRVVDVDNFISCVLREDYERARGLKARARRWLAWKKFRRYERLLFRRFDLCLAVSDRDRRILLELVGGGPQVEVVPNGVDTTYHRPGLAPVEAGALVFNGALTYRPNCEAMDFFLSRIFPKVLASVPEARLFITGRTDGVALDRLPLTERVRLTGYLKDIRPRVAGSWACVVPLLSGGGTRLKILEAMALGTPVVSTSKGAEGLEVTDGRHLLIADTAEDFARQTVRLLQEPDLRAELAANAHRLVLDKYDWADIGRRMRTLVESCRPRASSPGD